MKKSIEDINFGLERGEKSLVRLRARIDELEGLMFASPSRLEIPKTDYFAEGLYAREIIIPAGTVLTGKIHKYEHLNFIEGDISVLTEDGIKRITGSGTIVSPPGTKRVGYAHTDTKWTTVHATTEKCAVAAETALVVETREQYELFLEARKCLT